MQRRVAWGAMLLVMLWAAMAHAECTSDELFTELSTDPAVPPMNYATAYGGPITKGSGGNDQAVLDVINLVRQGTEYQVQRDLMPAYEVAAQMHPGEFAALTSTKLQQLVSLFAPLQVQVGSQNIRDILFNGTTAIFPNPGQTRTNLIAASKMQVSRAYIVCKRQLTSADISLAIRDTQ
jgi:hypothetical protein